MVDSEITREWIAKADDDFRFAQINLDEGKPFLAFICFHFQQSAEKYLKAYIIAHDLEFKKNPRPSCLAEDLHGRKQSLERLNSDCEFLNTFYIETRYPVHWPTHFTKQEAIKAKDAADRIRQVIIKALRSFI